MAKKKLIPLTESPHYARFTEERDKALEAILWVHLKSIDQIIGKLREKILDYVKLPRAVDDFVKRRSGPIMSDFGLATMQIHEILVRLRKEAYFLAHASEAEAIGRALGKPGRWKIHVRNHIQKPMHDGAHLADRAQLWMDRLRRKLEDALSLSLIQGSDEKEIAFRVKRVFGNPGPRPKRLKVQALTSHRESDPNEDPGSKVLSVSFGFADEEQWEEIQDDYFSEELPADIFRRGPTDKAMFYDVGADTTEERYAWDIEQEVSEDFVRSVRDGTQDAAAENGINDFEWVAILDSHTDDCCRLRDGKSSTEIEKLVSSGTLDSDECDAIVPPGHFNCRCRSVPMTEDMPAQVNADYSGFDEWLKETGKAA